MKKRSVSSVLAERIRQRRSVTPAKVSVRYVKFSPEEMAYDIDDTDPADWIPVGRGPGATFAKPSKQLIAIWEKQLAAASKKHYVRLDPDVRKAFPSNESVNQALRALMKQQKNGKSTRKKSA